MAIPRRTSASESKPFGRKVLDAWMSRDAGSEFSRRVKRTNVGKPHTAKFEHRAPLDEELESRGVTIEKSVSVGPSGVQGDEWALSAPAHEFDVPRFHQEMSLIPYYENPTRHDMPEQPLAVLLRKFETGKNASETDLRNVARFTARKVFMNDTEGGNVPHTGVLFYRADDEGMPHIIAYVKPNGQTHFHRAGEARFEGDRFTLTLHDHAHPAALQNLILRFFNEYRNGKLGYLS